MLRIKRQWADFLRPVRRHQTATTPEYPFLLAGSSSPLRTSKDPAERAMELGKIQNLRIVANRFNEVAIPAGEIVSFWRQLGKCTPQRGFVMGRQLQEGCLIPAVGGGICQFSNALFDAALKIGAEIAERHAHSSVVPGSIASADRDATVAWNYVDLRFKVPFDCQLRVNLSDERLEVAIYGKQPLVSQTERKVPRQLRMVKGPSLHSCGTCGQVKCRLHDADIKKDIIGTTAYLLDEFWPEFEEYIQSVRGESDELLIPIDGVKWNRRRYAWSTTGFGRCRTATLATLIRGLRSRRVAAQGAERQKALLDEASNLANQLGKQISFQAEHLVVSQNLLPFLWKGGFLGGRTFDVLMTRQPLCDLQKTLDLALAANPDRALLGDFRAPSELVELESQALAAARKLISPHRFIAPHDERRVLLDWTLPKPKTWTPGNLIVFPGPTVGRKGAHELREAAKQFDLEIGLLGPNLEGPDFWSGVRTKRLDPSANWLEGVCAVIQPALIEDKPRALLTAIAAGCPVIASLPCGVSGMPNVIDVEPGSVGFLTNVISAAHSG